MKKIQPQFTAPIPSQLYGENGRSNVLFGKSGRYVSFEHQAKPSKEGGVSHLIETVFRGSEATPHQLDLYA